MVLSVSRESLDATGRVILEAGRWCKIFYRDEEQRQKGRWSHGICSECGGYAPFYPMASTYHESNFCPDCGADMRIKETDCDYERAVEQLEHDMLYEPTFNQDDGSM